jgi:hypothetical protein
MQRKYQAKEKIPSLFSLVLLSTFVASYIESQILGFNLSGLGWFFPLLFGIYIIIIKAKKRSFPVFIWMPWTILLLLYLVASDKGALDSRVSALQRSIQLLSPLAVGLAASTYRPSKVLLEDCVIWLRRFAYVLFASLIVSSFSEIVVGGVTGLAAQTMTCMLLSVFFIVRYHIFNEKKDFFAYLIMAASPVLALTRTVIAATLFNLPFSFAPISAVKRISFAILVTISAILIFNLPQVQKKMFYSGEGELSAIGTDNPDFRTTGRGALWDKLLAEVSDSPWVGHGTGAGETSTYMVSLVGYPHNDWLLTYYDYSILGVTIYFVSNILMMMHCLIAARRTKTPQLKFFFLAGASTFIPFMLVMYTDNIMVYASYFGMLQYVLIGLAYGALAAEREAGKVFSRRPNPLVRR